MKEGFSKPKQNVLILVLVRFGLFHYSFGLVLVLFSHFCYNFRFHEMIIIIFVKF